VKKGMKFPLLINYNTKISLKKNAIVVPDDFPFLGFRFGIGGSKGIPVLSRNSLIIRDGAKLVLKGKCHISNGSSIRIDNGEVDIGTNFSANKNFLLTSSEKISINNDVTCGWNVSIRDSDGHSVFQSGIELENKKPVEIGNNCWINSWCDILKGVKIGDGCIIAYKSLVTSKISQFNTDHTLIGGHPAKVIRKEISWKK
jgi:acetyltransferase-like isoleucine patch superfamily enzyme